MSESLIRELAPGAVANRNLLHTLILSANLINTIDPAAFTNTPNIRNLNLQFNQLRSLDNNIFQVLPNLVELDLSFNIVERIPPTLFSNNLNLASINFNNNRITFINQTFFNNLPALLTLFFQNNICHSNTFTDLNFQPNRNQMMQSLQPCFVEGPSQFNCIFGFSFDGVSFDDYTCLLRNIEAYDINREINLGGFHLAGQNNNGVTQVWIHQSDTRFIINQMFLTFQNLRHVLIQTSNLQNLQENAFRNATNLWRITIEGNVLRRLEVGKNLY